MNKIKELLGKVLNFTTGLGFYGVGLLGGAALAFFLGWNIVAHGLIGAVIFKNYGAIVNYFRSLVDKE